MTSPRPRNRKLRLGSIVIVIAILIGVLVAAMDADRAKHILHHPSWRWVPVALLFTGLSYLCLSAGFSTMNRIFGIRLRQRDQMEIGFVAFALNNLVSVGGLAGYSLRVVLLRRRGMATGDIVGASLAHSYVNHLVMMSLLPVGLVYILVNHPLGQTRTLEMSLAVALSVLSLVVTTVLLAHDTSRARAARIAGRLGRRVLRRDVTPAVSRLEQTIGQGVAAIRGKPSVLAVPLLLVIMDWVTSVCALGACFLALRTPVHPGVLLTGFGIGVSAGLLSMVPGDWASKRARWRASSCCSGSSTSGRSWPRFCSASSITWCPL